ncbi:hypothetical protein BDV09DRAFT_153897 [Aspergillus tetrazonus]
MGSGRILGLAWHLHRSGSSSLSFRHFIFSHVNIPFLSSLLFSFPSFIVLPIHTTACTLSSRLVLSEFSYTVPTSKSNYLALAMSVTILPPDNSSTQCEGRSSQVGPI